jgi:hypothetical protein
MHQKIMHQKMTHQKNENGTMANPTQSELEILAILWRLGEMPYDFSQCYAKKS